VKTEPFAPARYLTSPESQIELLFDALATGDASYVAPALCVIARARFTSETAREAGITREALHRSLSEDGAPRLTTLLGVMRPLGVRPTGDRLPAHRVPCKQNRTSGSGSERPSSSQASSVSSSGIFC